MELKHEPDLLIPPRLITAIESFPLEREVSHCGERFSASPFDIYAECPKCGARLKVRSFSGVTEIEDVFDAVFSWMTQPGASELIRRRQQAISEDREADD
jgi:hypothetical protein